MSRKYYIVVAFFSFVQSTTAWGQQEKYAQRVKCSKDTSEEYALILPSSYSAEKRSPLIIFLDPGARGDLPVTMYRSLADRYGIILAGSFNSRNFDGTSSEQAFVSIYKDITGKYSIDPGMVCLSGFSGGARAAAAIAMRYPVVTGVIGCGAGFTDDKTADFGSLPPYVAIVGNHDMNFGELFDNHRQLDEMKIDNLLLNFYGIHEWPRVVEVELAISWLLHKTGAKNDLPLIDEKMLWENVTKNMESGFLYPAWLDAKSFEQIPSLQKKAGEFVSAIEEDKSFSQDKKLFERVLDEEREIMNEFSIAFSQLLLKPINQVSTGDWEKMISNVNRWESDNVRYRQLSGERCRDHFTRSCQEYFSQLSHQKNYAKCYEIAELLLLIEPGNPRPHFMMARAAAAMKNRKTASARLKEAVRLGLGPVKIIYEDEFLSALFTKEELRNIFIGD